ncbi:hypothetical protein [Paenibacillus sinopodophylli]|uniref:hypothetical protein n=1 Tax=Paenibacillus sinopodophylli TaxID=1837342 RepID=UPI00110C9997|nr:hypothetical protein [Paenibacillus sinopodophylli]
MQASLPPLLFSLLDVGMTTVVILIAGGFLTGMFMFVRMASDDSDRYKNLKEMVETIFGTPAHLRPSTDSSSTGTGDKDKDKPNVAELSPFSEPCPACSETITERDLTCPSCGLRLL